LVCKKLTIVSKTPDESTDFQVYKRLLPYTLRYWKVLLFSLLALVIAAATEPMFARVIKPLIDDNFNAQDRTMARWLPALILMIFVLRAVATYVNDTCSAWLSGRVVYDLRQQMLERIVQFPSRYFHENPAARLSTSVLTNVNAVTEAGFNIITVAIKDGITVLGLLGLLLYTNWRLTLICLIILPLVGLGLRLAAKRIAVYIRQWQESSGDLMQTLTEIIAAHRAIKIYGAQRTETSTFLTNSNRIRQMALKVTSTSSINSGVVQFFMASAVAMVVYFAGRLAAKGQMTAGDFASFMTAMLMLMSPIKRLTALNQSLQKGLVAARDVFQVIDSELEVDHGTHEVQRAIGQVEFMRVGFSYAATSEPVLHNINLHISPGMTVGIVGESGSGKSTLISLLPRLFEKTAGQLLIDGVDVSQWRLSSLRRQMAIVTQESHLFNDTVFNNIAYGEMAAASMDQVRQAAKMANALDFIEALPQGFETVLGDAGIRLSGGQRQRISIARAFLKDAPILIFDEATSALDNVAEREVQRDMEILSRGRTTFIVAHRLSTLIHANLIVVMRHGCIVESGSHEQLLQTAGHYAKLYQSQFAK
jgi:ATP-binding cassette, subfamily B, bacterial MsbA